MTGFHSAERNVICQRGSLFIEYMKRGPYCLVALLIRLESVLAAYEPATTSSSNDVYECW